MNSTQLGSNPPQPTGPNEAEKAHPLSNRGVQNTKPAQNGPHLHEEGGLFLDYLRGTVDPLTFDGKTDPETGEVTIHCQPNQKELARIFGELTPMGYSSQAGYDQSATLACGGSIHWHTTQPEQRIMINLGSEALAQLGIHPLTLFEKLTAMGFKATRMDWAKDDTEGLIDLGVVSEKIRKGELVTRFKKWNRIDGGVIGDDTITGETLYIGNRKSESFLRVYDKQQSTPKRASSRTAPATTSGLNLKSRNARRKSYCCKFWKLTKTAVTWRGWCWGLFMAWLTSKSQSQKPTNRAGKPAHGGQSFWGLGQR
jgi:hypothetical protein